MGITMTNLISCHYIKTNMLFKRNYVYTQILHYAFFRRIALTKETKRCERGKRQAHPL
jgi:hypothetical protein